jgi:hypothetical protein
MTKLTTFYDRSSTIFNYVGLAAFGTQRQVDTQMGDSCVRQYAIRLLTDQLLEKSVVVLALAGVGFRHFTLASAGRTSTT